MTELDPRSILLMVGLGLVVPAISLTVVWRLFRGLPGLGYWTLSTWSAFSVVFLIGSARGDAPSVWVVILTNASVLGTALLIHAGCRAYAGKASINKTVLLPALAAGLLVIGVLRLTQVHPTVHLTFQALFAGAAYAASALVLWHMPALRPALKFLVCLVFGLHSVFLVLGRPFVMHRRYQFTESLMVPPIVSIESFFAWSFIILSALLLTVDHLYRQNRAALERQRRLFAVIGHELRTPAAALSMLLTRARQEQPTADDLGLMQDQSDHLVSVLDEMRYIVRPRDSTEPLPMGTTTLSALTTKVMGSLRPMMAIHGFEGKLRLNEGADMPLKLSVQLLRQILTNLVKNAIVHSRGDTIWIEVRLLLGDLNPSFELKVCDNGIGLKNATALFEPYVRGDTEADGSGLGLFICKSLAEQMDAQLSHADRPGGGSCFVLRLTAEVDASASSNAQSEAPAIQLSNLSVLLVEDNPVIRKVSEALLSNAGVHVTSVSNGEEALQAVHAQTNGFGLILTDIMMPQLDGYAMSRQLRQSGYSGTIIGVSAATIGEESERMLEAGANACLAKPLTLEKLTVAIQSVAAVADRA